MRTVTVALACALGALILTMPATDSRAQGKSDRPERTLTCDESRPGGCDVSCVTAGGTPLFVYDRVRSVLITEFAARHTLLEVQRSGAGEIVSVLIGDISHCTLNGLRDPNLATRGR